MSSYCSFSDLRSLFSSSTFSIRSLTWRASLLDTLRPVSRARFLPSSQSPHCSSRVLCGRSRVIWLRHIKMYRYNEWDEELQAKSEAQEKKIEEQLQDIARKNDWFIRTQGDPRGATVQIDFFNEPNESQECSHTHILYV